MCWETSVLLGDAIDLSFTALDKGDVEDSVINDTFPALQHKENSASITAVLQGSPLSYLPHCWVGPLTQVGVLSRKNPISNWFLLLCGLLSRQEMNLRALGIISENE